MAPRGTVSRITSGKRQMRGLQELAARQERACRTSCCHATWSIQSLRHPRPCTLTLSFLARTGEPACLSPRRALGHVAAGPVCDTMTRIRYGDAMRYSDRIESHRQKIQNRPVTMRTALYNTAFSTVQRAWQPHTHSGFRPGGSLAGEREVLGSIRS